MSPGPQHLSGLGYHGMHPLNILYLSFLPLVGADVIGKYLGDEDYNACLLTFSVIIDV